MAAWFSALFSDVTVLHLLYTMYLGSVKFLLGAFCVSMCNKSTSSVSLTAYKHSEVGPCV